METQVPYTADAAQLATIQKKMALDSRMRGGIGWFYWIAGLSLVNTLAYLFGTGWTFVAGLGITQIIDALMSLLVKDLGSGWDVLRAVGVGIDVLIAAAFVLMGYAGRKRVRWPVIVGMVLYGLDTILVLVFRDFFAAAFHGWALFGIWTGLKAMRELNALEATGGSESVESLRARMPSLQQPSITPGQTRLRVILVGLILLVIVFTCVIVLLQR